MTHDGESIDATFAAETPPVKSEGRSNSERLKMPAAAINFVTAVGQRQYFQESKVEVKATMQQTAVVVRVVVQSFSGSAHLIEAWIPLEVG